MVCYFKKERKDKWSCWSWWHSHRPTLKRTTVKVERTGLDDAFPPPGTASHQRRRHLPLSADCSPSTSATITATSSSSRSGRHLVNKGQAIRHLDGQLICHPLDKRVSVRSCPRGLIPQQAVKVKRFKEHPPPDSPSTTTLPRVLPTPSNMGPPPAPTPPRFPPLSQLGQKIPFGMGRCRPSTRLLVFGRVSRSRCRCLLLMLLL